MAAKAHRIDQFGACLPDSVDTFEPSYRLLSGCHCHRRGLLGRFVFCGHGHPREILLVSRIVLGVGS